ncbi:hypothetical protein HOLleu_22106 [Holothuria leucospilota]|uniref:Uncharacterized protein n=1 Tax=Holothuria leucospilota TaxID=206669 RepID=A0A9Q1BYP8_HOLLE|nr:hypothetical protein HOLleu_22106 [Holothuria leucospilota]
MARRTATKLPTVQKLLEPVVIAPQKIQQDIEKRQNKARHYFDQKTIHLKPLQQQDTIRVRVGKQWKPARLLFPNRQPRSYNLETEQGKIWRRNRRDILKTNEQNIFQKEPPDDGLEGCLEAVSSNPKTPQRLPLNKPPNSFQQIFISITDP